ncbi:hypothetical protein MIND_00853600 [Mycena indigotica]|uniref:DUF6534 domain-containing protein n=1 Tax=Mycena indigotica TaxID=2126181 RepID=A0A8H6SGC5_9AGAR|nr:uncharacterized protein MIND_00853600 [Mycena indigotica]KAF7299053.1 hypothetical protein MIND_00853600 [Mycena indigotica]
MTVSLQSTFGSAFVGLVVSAVLYGVTILQTQISILPVNQHVRRQALAHTPQQIPRGLQNNEMDGICARFVRFSASGPVRSQFCGEIAPIPAQIVRYSQNPRLLDTAHLVLCTIAVYTVLVLNFNNPEILTKATWSINVGWITPRWQMQTCTQVQTDLNGLIGLIVECFYARRVWIVSRNLFLTVLIASLVLSIVHFGLGIVFTVGSFETDRNDFSSLVWVTSAGLGSAAAADLLIGISLCYYLSKSRTGIPRTDNLISTLMKYSLTTGFLTGIIACCVVITFGIMPNNFVYVAFFWLLGKCYVNSVLAALNSREALRERVKPNTFMNMSALMLNTPTSARSTDRFRPSLVVNVDTRVVSKTDSSLPPSAV